MQLAREAKAASYMATNDRNFPAPACRLLAAHNPLRTLCPPLLCEETRESTMDAKCQCGQLSVNLPGPSLSVVACHCSDCHRRSGSPFGVLAYYSDDCVKIAGEATRYERPTATGGTFETFFCPTCGSTVYARAGKHPTLIGIAVGAICDPTYPSRSVGLGGRQHDWVVIPEPAQQFSRGRL